MVQQYAPGAAHCGAPLADEHVGCHPIDDELWEVNIGPVPLGLVDTTREENETEAAFAG